MRPFRSRRSLAALSILLTLAPAGPAALAGGSPSPAPGATPVITEHATWCDDPGPAHAAYCESLGPDLDDAGWCDERGVQVERCYHAGSARIVVRGGAKRSIEVPLLIGERHDPDLGGDVWLEYGGHGDALLTLGIPAVPGTSEITTDAGAPLMDWSVSGIGSGNAIGCTMEMTADALGVMTGTVRCPDARSEAGKRLRLTVRFRAVPLVAGPLPSPMPLPTLQPSAGPDPVCGLVDQATLALATGADPGRLRLLPAGPGRCVGFGGDVEVAELILVEGAGGSPLGDGTTWRGAPCTPLPMAAPDLIPTAAACSWPDGRRFAVASAMDGSTALVLSLSMPESVGPSDRVPQATIDGLTALLREAVARGP